MPAQNMYCMVPLEGGKPVRDQVFVKAPVTPLSMPKKYKEVQFLTPS